MALNGKTAIAVLGVLIVGVLQFLGGCEPSQQPVAKPASPATSSTTRMAGAAAITVDLVPVTCEQEVVVSGQNLYFYNKAFSKPLSDSGTVHPDARIATVTTPAGSTIKLAIDARDPKSKNFDVLRVDFTGKGKFADADIVPAQTIRMGTAIAVAAAAPKVELTAGGKKRPFMFSANMNLDPSALGTAWGYLDFGTALEGAVTIADKRYQVQVQDYNRNGLLGDRCQVACRNGKVQGTDFGDLVVLRVPPPKGLFAFLRSDSAAAEPSIRAFYGQPMCIAGKWYKATISDDQSKLTFAPVEVPTGQLTTADGVLNAGLLVGAANVVILSGTKTTELPPDKYALIRAAGDITRPKDAMRTAMLRCNWDSNPQGFTPRILDIAAAQNVQLKLGELDSRLEFGVSVGQVDFSYGMTHAFAGDASLTLAGASSLGVVYVPKGVPALTITDSAGKTIHTGTMEFG